MPDGDQEGQDRREARCQVEGLVTCGDPYDYFICMLLAGHD